MLTCCTEILSRKTAGTAAGCRSLFSSYKQNRPQYMDTRRGFTCCYLCLGCGVALQHGRRVVSYRLLLHNNFDSMLFGDTYAQMGNGNLLFQTFKIESEHQYMHLFRSLLRNNILLVVCILSICNLYLCFLSTGCGSSQPDLR